MPSAEENKKKPKLEINAEAQESSESENTEKMQEIAEAEMEKSENESRKDFAERMGVSFSKEEMLKSSPREQADYILESNQKTAQFSVGSARSLEEYLPIIAELMENDPELAISIHVSSPAINAESLSWDNGEKLSRDIQLAAEADCSPITIHPGTLPIREMQKLTEEIQEKILDSLADFYAGNISQTKNSGKVLELAIENLPAKGIDGNWGQQPEDLAKIIAKTRQSLVVNFGFKAEEAVAAVGMTLDVNHALTGLDEEKKAEKLSEWFRELGQDIKCIHVYTPSDSRDGRDSVNNQLEILRRLGDKFNVKPEILLESKKDLETTKGIFDAGRKSILGSLN